MRSSYRGVMIDKADSVDEIFTWYREEWTSIEEAAANLRRAKEEEVQQLQAASYTSGQEAERVRFEAERARTQTEINELRAMLAALSESARSIGAGNQ